MVLGVHNGPTAEQEYDAAVAADNGARHSLDELLAEFGIELTDEELEDARREIDA